ncbi:MAG: S1 family peptidase [Gammaproteobacteria bacterium]
MDLHRLSRHLVVFLSLLCHALPVLADEGIFALGERGVFEVRVTQRETGNEVSHGSGFIAGAGDLLITNYHVVEPVIGHPGSYRLELFAPDGARHGAELLDFDVIHDLAVVRAERVLGEPFPLAGPPARGERLFSMGNPLDLGLTLSRSTNNGPLEASDSDRLLLSGTLNPGMSGGPTFDAQGRVVGINVAIAGDELALVIPAEFAGALLARVGERGGKAIDDPAAAISAQVIAHLNRRHARMAAATRTLTTLGAWSFPDAIDHTVRCWDDSREPEPADYYLYTGLACSNQYGIYIDDERSFGIVDYEFGLLRPRDIGRLHFARIYEGFNNHNLHNVADDESHTPFACLTRFVSLAERSFKTTICRRDYRDYPGLSDVLFTAALVGDPQLGVFARGTLEGVPYPGSITVIEKLLGAMAWKPR